MTALDRHGSRTPADGDCATCADAGIPGGVLEFAGRRAAVAAFT